MNVFKKQSAQLCLITFLTGLLITSHLSHAQNLALDPSFEEATSTISSRADTWLKEHDVNHVNFVFKNGELDGVSAYQGERFALFQWRYGTVNDVETYQSYTINKLAKPLEAGKVYDFNCFALLSPNADFAIKDLGIAFTTDIPQFDGHRYAHTDFMDISGDITPNQWTKLEGQYIAKGGEQYVLLGSFKPKEEQAYRVVKRSHLTKNVGKVGRLLTWNYLKKFNLNADYAFDGVFVKESSIQFMNEWDSELRLEKDSTIFTRSIQFQSAGIRVAAESFAYLDAVAAYLQKHQHLKMKIIGHTDSRGAVEFNAALSRKRSISIAQYLVSKSIAKERLMVEGRGEASPIAPNATEQGRTLNRRVELVFQE